MIELPFSPIARMTNMESTTRNEKTRINRSHRSPSKVNQILSSVVFLHIVTKSESKLKLRKGLSAASVG